MIVNLNVADIWKKKEGEKKEGELELEVSRRFARFVVPADPRRSPSISKIKRLYLAKLKDVLVTSCRSLNDRIDEKIERWIFETKQMDFPATYTTWERCSTVVNYSF